MNTSTPPHFHCALRHLHCILMIDMSPSPTTTHLLCAPRGWLICPPVLRDRSFRNACPPCSLTAELFKMHSCFLQQIACFQFLLKLVILFGLEPVSEAHLLCFLCGCFSPSPGDQAPSASGTRAPLLLLQAGVGGDGPWTAPLPVCSKSF